MRFYRENKAVSSRCRGPSYFSLCGQRKVTKREATPMARPPGILPSGCAGGWRGFSAAPPCAVEKLARIPASHPADFPPPTRRAIGAPGRAARSKRALFKRAEAPHVCGALALASGAHDARPLYPGPLGDGETGTIRPRRGPCQGRQRLFDRTGVRPKSPATAHGLSAHGGAESGAAGCSFSLSTQRESSSGADRRSKPL